MSNNRYNKLAADLKEALPPEVLHALITDDSTILHILPAKEPNHAAPGLTAERTAEVENAAIDVLNKFYTDLIRHELKKLA